MRFFSRESPWWLDVRRLHAISIPLAATFVVDNVIALTNSFIVGKLGAAHLAAYALASRVAVDVGYVTCFSIVGMAGVFVAQAHGSRRDAVVRESVTHALWLAVLLSIPGMVAMLAL
jgi:Na+-driven multidrug efflux pump